MSLLDGGQIARWIHPPTYDPGDPGVVPTPEPRPVPVAVGWR